MFGIPESHRLSAMCCGKAAQDAHKKKRRRLTPESVALFLTLVRKSSLLVPLRLAGC